MFHLFSLSSSHARLISSPGKRNSKTLLYKGFSFQSTLLSRFFPYLPYSHMFVLHILSTECLCVRGGSIFLFLSLTCYRSSFDFSKVVLLLLFCRYRRFLSFKYHLYIYLYIPIYSSDPLIFKMTLK
jgi:hypothetical protein